MHFVAAQIFGFVGVVFFLLSYFPKSNRALYLLQAAGCIAFGIQFYLLGAYSGCASQVFIITRNVILSMYNHRGWVRWKGWVPVFILIGIAITAFTWDGPESLLPLLTMTVGTIAMWTNNAGIIRIVCAGFLSPTWIVYEILTGAYISVINEIVVMASAALSVYRYGWKELMDPESEFQKR